MKSPRKITVQPAPAQPNTIDDLVITFDEAWQEDTPPDINAYLERVAPEHRPTLLHELVLVDLEHRTRRGQTMTLADYTTRFSALVDDNEGLHRDLVVASFAHDLSAGKSVPFKSYLERIAPDETRTILFWDLVRIVLAQPSSPPSRSLKDCLGEFRDCCGDTTEVPIDVVVRQFERDCKGGGPAPLSDYADFVTPARKPELFRELIPADIARQRRNGTTTWLEDYGDDLLVALAADGSIPDSMVAWERSVAASGTLDTGDRCPHCLAAQNDKGSVCNACGRDITNTDGRPRIDVPEAIDNYQIIRLVGVGGYGAVYKGWGPEARRFAALKVPLASTVAVGNVNRLRREAEIASTLHHPNIVAVQRYHIDDGTGVSYIAYDYINSRTAGSLPRQTPDDIKATATFIAAAADAVHYAHHKFIIHRDLKPGNILIDPDGAPLITDFGLARYMMTIQNNGRTAEGRLIGTPEYMSPEQISGNPVDYRSDIYSLGVTFYRLLTGQTPFSADTYTGLKTRICTDHPKPPSSLAPQVAKAFDDICVRALAKKPQHRYATAAALAADIRRCINGKPAVAAAPRWPHRFALWCRWHPTPALIRGSLLLLPIVVVALLWMMHADRRRLDVSKSRDSQKDSVVLQHYYDNLARASTLVEETGKEQPWEDERIRIIIDHLQSAGLAPGETARAVTAIRSGDFDGTINMLAARTASPADLYCLGTLHILAGDHAAALAAFTSGLQLSPQANEWTHALTRGVSECHIATGDYKTANHHMQAALEIARTLYGAVHIAVAMDLNLLGDTWYYLGAYREAGECFEEAYKIDVQLFGDHHPAVARDLDRLGGIEDALGNYAAAVDLFERARDIDLAALGPDHENTARDWSHLGSATYSVGDYEAAKTCFTYALLIYEKLFGTSHTRVAQALDNLGGALFELEEYERAIRCFERALEIDTTLHGEYSPFVARDLNHLSGALIETGDIERAISMLTRSYKINSAASDRPNPDVANDLRKLGMAWMRLGDHNKARAHFQQALTIDNQVYPAEHTIVARDIFYLGRAELELGNTERARELLNKSYRIHRRTIGDAHSYTREAAVWLEKARK